MVVNDFLVSYGLEKALVLYWYQTKGRVIQSEYVAKFWMLADALMKHRTDGALVRIMIPLGRSEAEARSWGVSFVQTLNGSLQGFLPN
jgi:EpsI family protein